MVIIQEPHDIFMQGVGCDFESVPGKVESSEFSTPTNLRLLQGNAPRRPLNQNEPKPKLKPRTPRGPAHLGPAGKTNSQRLAREMVSLGLLTELDMTALRLCCDSFETCANAMRNIHRIESIIKTHKEFLMTSPLFRELCRERWHDTRYNRCRHRHGEFASSQRQKRHLIWNQINEDTYGYRSMSLRATFLD